MRMRMRRKRKTDRNEETFPQINENQGKKIEAEAQTLYAMRLVHGKSVRTHTQD